MSTENNEYGVLIPKIAGFYRNLKNKSTIEWNKNSKPKKIKLEEECKNKLLKLFEETFNSFKLYELEIDEDMNKLSYYLGSREFGTKYKDKYLQVKIDYNSLLKSNDVTFDVTNSNKISYAIVGSLFNRKTINISNFIEQINYGRRGRWVINLLDCKDNNTFYFKECCSEFLTDIYNSDIEYNDFQIFKYIFSHPYEGIKAPTMLGGKKMKTKRNKKYKKKSRKNYK
jgi:hypothetical protein